MNIYAAKQHTLKFPAAGQRTGRETTQEIAEISRPPFDASITNDGVGCAQSNVLVLITQCPGPQSKRNLHVSGVGVDFVYLPARTMLSSKPPNPQLRDVFCNRFHY